MESRTNGFRRVVPATVLVVSLASSALAGDVFNACSSNKTNKLRPSSVLVNATPVCKVRKETARTWNDAPLGFAHVLANGTVDLSKNVVTANVSPGIEPGVYCFKGLPFTPQNITATVELGGESGPGSGINLVQVSIASNGYCEGPTQAVAVTKNVTTGVTPLNFFVVFN
jgi:hypothetical protein